MSTVGTKLILFVYPFLPFSVKIQQRRLTLGLFLLHGRLGYCDGMLLRSHRYVNVIFGSFKAHVSFYRPAALTDAFVVFTVFSDRCWGRNAN